MEHTKAYVLDMHTRSTRTLLLISKKSEIRCLNVGVAFCTALRYSRYPHREEGYETELLETCASLEQKLEPAGSQHLKRH